MMRKFLSAFVSLAVVGMTALPLSFTAAASTANTASSGSYNYGEAMQKAIMFYEFQRSGAASPDQRNNWRGDSGMSDGSDVGLDLTGGYYDAGDNVKFNLPMSYTSAMLAWNVYENKDALEQSGQLSYMKTAIKWITDYLIKCHPSANVFYYQVGDGSLDHSWWGPSEVMQMKRPSYCVTESSPGSTVCGEAAAALASASIIFADSDPTYSATCLKNAEELFTFADDTKSDAGYTAASGYYNSWSGFYDELSWSATWLYLATKDSTYLTKAQSYMPKWNKQGQSDTIEYEYTQCWDDVHYGTELLLARITGDSTYKESMERCLDWWTTGYDGAKITYTPDGLAYLSQWGSLRYATTTAFLAGVYAKWTGCPSTKAATYKAFAKTQVDYALGSTGRSYEIGYGTKYPQHPHHRTAESSWADSQSTPNYCRHTLVGALVGGPDSSDGYTDEVSNYTQNEPACDYNAGFIGALTEMYADYGGTPIDGLTANETPTNDEFFVTASVNAASTNFEEIKAVLNNESGWPAKNGTKLSYKYFVDISELVKAGYSAKDVTITTNYNAGATVSGLLPWDKENNIYYVNVDFTGTNVYPGGQSAYKKECQFRIAYPSGVVWDNSNDFSYTGINTTAGGTPALAKDIPVYNAGVLVFGKEPTSSVSSTISATAAAFDLKTANQADIPVTVTLNGNTLDGIYNGTAELVKGTDYTVSGNTVTILKSYLAKQSAGTLSLRFDFSAGSDPVLTVAVTDTTTFNNSAISPKSAAFDLNTANQADIPVTVTLNGNTLDGIYNGTAELTEGTDYTVSGSTYTILKSYLAKQSVGTLDLKFDFSHGTDAALSVAISDTTVYNDSAITPVTAEFDIYKQADIPVNVTLNGNTLDGIYNGTAALVKGTDYTAADDGTVTILSAYLAKQPVGTTNLKFDFSHGTDATLAITVINSTPVVKGSLEVKMFNSGTSSSTNGITPHFELVNNGSTAIDLSTVTLRYYYTKDGTQSQNFWCDWSSAGTSNIKSTFVSMDTAVDNSDTYLEIGFASGAGSLAPGASTEIQARFANNDWSNYTQTNDYSYNPTSTSYTDWIYATAYVNGTIEWGMEPTGSGTTTATVSSLADTTAATTAGTAPTLPGTVAATYSDGTTANVAVTWDSIDASSYADAGTFTVKGTVSGTTLTATCTVTVEAAAVKTIASLKDVTAATTAGTAPTLPGKVTATYSDGTTGSVAVTWDSIKASDYAEAGTFTVSGTVFGTTLTVTCTVTVNAKPAPATGSLEVQMYSGSTQAATNGIAPRFKLTNTGSTAIDLSAVTLRYYFTEDGTQSQSFWCDWSTVGSSNVTSKFVKLDTAVTGADNYLEIGFTSGAGTLAPGASVEVQARFSKNDWSNYNQSDDYSFDSSDTAYADWTKVTAYQDGTLIWGVEA